MRYGQCAAMIALDLRCPVERPVASCRKVARQQSFESRSHGLSLKLYARSCPGSFEGGSCRYHPVRSEEHTSELQSLMRISYAVFCLKKKSKSTTPQHKT